MPNRSAAVTPHRIAVVGAGPAGFFSVEALLKSAVPFRVTLIEQLPVPYGLVRYGVAPDHPEIKRVTRQFDGIAVRPEVDFWGGVQVGRDVSVAELRQAFDAVILACGTPDSQSLAIPGEDLPGSLGADAFVGWYNGFPDLGEIVQTLETDSAVVIGNGNVAMDVARILAKTEAELRETDITAAALSTLAANPLRTIHVVGRRGPAQAAWTPAELKEFGDLTTCSPYVVPSELELDPISEQELLQPGAAPRRKAFEILQRYADRPARYRRVEFRFLRSPSRLLGTDRVEGVQFVRNRLCGEPGFLRPEATGEMEEVGCGLVIRCIGYRGRPLPGVPFDDRTGLVVSREGRIDPGLYAAGWIRHGPRGLIGNSKKESAGTVASLLADLPHRPPAPGDPARLRARLEARGVCITAFTDWQRMDAAEVERGRRAGKPREKFTTTAGFRACLQPDLGLTECIQEPDAPK
jgi:ferredoxin--NADP+ reductase